MVLDFDIKSFFKKNSRQVLLTIFLFWFIFGSLILIEDELVYRLFGMKAVLVDRLQYCIRWFLWTLLTPVIIGAAIRFPVQKGKILAGLSRHFLFAILFTCIEFLLEIPIIRFITFRIDGAAPPVSEYASVFILKFNIYLLLYFLIVGTTYLVLYINSYNRSRVLAAEADIKNQLLQTQLAEAKLSLLKMQLDPHFLFNTHHSIVSLMMNNENEKAIKMLTGLSDLLRQSLDDTQQTIPLEKEIDLLKLYLGIQQARFQDRLNITYDIDPVTLTRKVPAFILQPLAENAIKHGIAVSSKANHIRIHASVTHDQLNLSVENDGAHIDFYRYKEGIGISNTKERLYQLYHNHSVFELKNKTGAGVIASVNIPQTEWNG